MDKFAAQTLDHYRDICSGCSDLWSKLANKPDGEISPYFICSPHDGDFATGLFAYVCPIGHAWATRYAIDRRGYFSDCECPFCTEARAENGEQTYSRPPAYSTGDAAHQAIQALLASS